MITPNKTKQELLEKLLVTVVKIRQVIFQAVTSSAKDPVATILQMLALTYLADYPGVSVGELAKELNMSSPAITQFVNRLSKANLVIRITDRKDRRITRLTLTQKGHEQSKNLPDMVHQRMSELFAPLSEKELKKTNQLLSKLFKNIKK